MSRGLEQRVAEAANQRTACYPACLPDPNSAFPNTQAGNAARAEYLISYQATGNVLIAAVASVEIGAMLLARLGIEGAATATAAAVIRFGKDPNQVAHAFRHVEAIGLDRGVVAAAVEKHLSTVISQLQPGKPLNQVIVVAGERIQYTAYLVEQGIINVGRIHPVP
jgi:hypothetical protein